MRPKQPDHDQPSCDGNGDCDICQGCPTRNLILGIAKAWEQLTGAQFEQALQKNPVLLTVLANKYLHGADYPKETLDDMRAAARSFFLQYDRLPNPNFPCDYNNFLRCLVDHFQTAEEMRKKGLLIVTEQLLIERAQQFADALHCTRTKELYAILEAVKALTVDTGSVPNPNVLSNIMMIRSYVDALGGINC